MKKLQLVYLRGMEGVSGCIPHNHYDLCTDEKDPLNVACILVSGKENVDILKKMVKLYNNTLKEE